MLSFFYGLEHINLILVCTHWRLSIFPTITAHHITIPYTLIKYTIYFFRKNQRSEIFDELFKKKYLKSDLFWPNFRRAIYEKLFFLDLKAFVVNLARKEAFPIYFSLKFILMCTGCHITHHDADIAKAQISWKTSTKVVHKNVHCKKYLFWKCSF